MTGFESVPGYLLAFQPWNELSDVRGVLTSRQSQAEHEAFGSVSVLLRPMCPHAHGDDLPCGWVCQTAGSHEIWFTHAESGLAVTATRTDAISSRFDVVAGWRLTLRRRAGEYVDDRSFGYVATQTAALDGLVACMERLTEAVRCVETARDVDLESVLDAISLRNEIPAPSNRGLDWA